MITLVVVIVGHQKVKELENCLFNVTKWVDDEVIELSGGLLSSIM